MKKEYVKIFEAIVQTIVKKIREKYRDRIFIKCSAKNINITELDQMNTSPFGQVDAIYIDFYKSMNEVKKSFFGTVWVGFYPDGLIFICNRKNDGKDKTLDPHDPEFIQLIIDQIDMEIFGHGK